MQGEGEERGPVTFAFSKSPKDGYEQAIEEDALKSQSVRLAAVLKEEGHEYRVFLILYPDSPGHGYGKAHQLLGTQVGHEAKMGPLGLKTQ